MHYRTPLSRVRGLGSIQSGTHHWWMQRITAVALIPLSLFVVSFLDLMLDAPYQQTVTWLAEPFHSAMIIAWLLCVFYHAALGLKVVIEDYVSNESVKLIAIWSVNLLFSVLTLSAVLAVLRIIFIIVG